MLALAHGDVELELDDADDAVRQYFAAALPTDRYDVLVDRRLVAGRLLWHRVFGGVLDLPWSLRFDAEARTANLQAFSYSKHAERSSAELVRRNVTGRTLTANLSAGATTVNVNTTDILAGDEIEVSDLTNRETLVVREIISGTQLRVFEAFDNAFSSGNRVELLTPYLRSKGIAYLAGQLLAAAGIDSQAVMLEHELASSPIATPISTEGFPRRGVTGGAQFSGDLAVPRGWTVRNGRLWCLPSDVTPLNERDVTDPRGIWQDLGSSGTVALEWTAYRGTEPATHEIGFQADTAYGGQAPDYDIGDTWYQNPDGGTQHYKLYTIGGGLQTSIFDFGTDIPMVTVEVVPPDTPNVWVSYVSTAAKTATKYWNGATFTTIEASMGGMLRFLRRLNLVALHERATGPFAPGAFTTNLHLYDPTTKAKTRTITVPEGLLARTLRVFDQVIAGLYTLGPTTRCRIWDLDWNQLADYEVAQRAVLISPAGGVGAFEAFVTVFTEPATSKEVLCCFAGNQMFVLARSYAGVIPYADFEGLSVAGALAELAKPAGAYVEIDEYGVGSIRSRLADDVQRRGIALDIDEPLALTTRPIWEFYRTSAQVTGETEAGDDIDELAGDTGDSANRIEISGPLITTPSVAQAIGNQYVSILNQKVVQAELTVCEVDQHLRVFDYVRMDGARWLIVEASLKPDARTYQLKLVEVG